MVARRKAAHHLILYSAGTSKSTVVILVLLAGSVRDAQQSRQWRADTREHCRSDSSVGILDYSEWCSSPWCRSGPGTVWDSAARHRNQIQARDGVRLPTGPKPDHGGQSAGTSTSGGCQQAGRQYQSHLSCQTLNQRPCQPGQAIFRDFPAWQSHPCI